MQTKLFQVLDKMTFIPVMVTKISYEDSKNPEEAFLVRKAGFVPRSPAFLYTVMPAGESQLFPEEWGDRTKQTSHKYIAENFDGLEGGSVVDVEYILGETKEPKPSERESEEDLLSDMGLLFHF